MEKESFFQTPKGTLANNSIQEEKNTFIILLGCEYIKVY